MTTVELASVPSVILDWEGKDYNTHRERSIARSSQTGFYENDDIISKVTKFATVSSRSPHWGWSAEYKKGTTFLYESKIIANSVPLLSARYTFGDQTTTGFYIDCIGISSSAAAHKSVYLYATDGKSRSCSGPLIPLVILNKSDYALQVIAGTGTDFGLVRVQ